MRENIVTNVRERRWVFITYPAVGCLLKCCIDLKYMIAHQTSYILFIIFRVGMGNLRIWCWSSSKQCYFWTRHLKMIYGRLWLFCIKRCRIKSKGMTCVGCCDEQEETIRNLTNLSQKLVSSQTSITVYHRHNKKIITRFPSILSIQSRTSNRIIVLIYVTREISHGYNN